MRANARPDHVPWSVPKVLRGETEAGGASPHGLHQIRQAHRYLFSGFVTHRDEHSLDSLYSLKGDALKGKRNEMERATRPSKSQATPEGIQLPPSRFRDSRAHPLLAS